MTNDRAQFTDLDLAKALAVVNVFETGRPFGEYSALAILNDGAGISYGINQFTHRSGSLAAVVAEYLSRGGKVGRQLLAESLPLFRSASPAAIATAAGNEKLKASLRAAAATREMRAAQHHIAFERYLRPAVEACAGSGFVLPLSLAVVYDSMTHGSWERIRDHVRIPTRPFDGAAFETVWITAYVKARHQWLRSVPRLKATSYRTQFFLEQIIADNWHLELPFRIHGRLLTHRDFPPGPTGVTLSTAGHPAVSSAATIDPPETPNGERLSAFPPAADDARPSNNSSLKKLGNELADAYAKYDRLESAVRTIVTRADSAKSLWTTVAGTAWQTIWAVVSFFIGLPREVWLAVAVIAAVLMLVYLYRQIVLGRIRESQLLMPNTERSIISVEKSYE
jgi:hypothetical protein